MKLERQQITVEVVGDIADHAPGRAQFRAEVLAGFRAWPRTLPCKYFYDVRGARLFEMICEVDEYYPTRAELAILREHVNEMAAQIGPDALLVEYGSGEGLKTRILLEALIRPAGYVPVDISREQLEQNANDLRRQFPRLEVLPICADFTADYELPNPARRPSRRVIYFPGSSIGNFTPDEAHTFLAQVLELVGPGGGLLIGFDRIKDRAVLEAAYNDAQGVTAAFNLNLLRRINRELNGDFDLSGWEHCALWNENEGRMEMHLVSAREQEVRIGWATFTFAAGVTIHTENSYKYDSERILGLAADAGWTVESSWQDPDRLFSVDYLAAV